MDSRCAGCEVEKKLKNLQVLRHVIQERERRCGAPDEEYVARDGVTRKGSDPGERPAGK